jgi:hypothetical protein
MKRKLNIKELYEKKYELAVSDRLEAINIKIKEEEKA